MQQHVDVVMAEPATPDPEPVTVSATQDEAPRRARKPRSAGEGETNDR